MKMCCKPRGLVVTYGISLRDKKYLHGAYAYILLCNYWGFGVKSNVCSLYKFKVWKSKFKVNTIILYWQLQFYFSSGLCFTLILGRKNVYLIESIFWENGYIHIIHIYSLFYILGVFGGFQLFWQFLTETSVQGCFNGQV